MSPTELHQAILAALTHQQAGELAEAERGWREILAGHPDHNDARLLLAAALAGQQKWDEAIAEYREALRHRPDNCGGYNNLGAALAANRQLDEAVAAYQEAIRQKPDFADAYSNLGATYWDMQRSDEAFNAYQAAIRADPNHAPARNNLGNYLLAQGRCEEAVASFQQAARIRPDFVQAWCNLGIALMECQAYERAGAALARGLELAPGEVEPHWSSACYALLVGDFQRGWLEYEWRWRTKSSNSPRINYPQPTWSGEELNGRTILLYTEQGFGDSIQFIRYAPLIARRGGRVILKCRPEMGRLMKGVEGIQQIITGDDLPPFDLYCPLMTLPLVFATRLESIPGETPYLRVDTTLRETWQEKVKTSLADFPGSSSSLKVGLVWAGGSTYINDRKRSVALAQLAPLARSPNTLFFTLQKGSAAAEAAHPPPGMTLIDLTADLTDFADTAALIAQLDLVIAVDTGVAHLAGALGKPVWLMLPTNPDWRWLLDRDDSPWYPTMRLFRQTQRGEWADVIERVAGALAGLQAEPSADAAPISPDVPRKLSTADAIALAYQHHQAGRLAEAGGIYRQILAQQPDNVDVLHLMGLAAIQARRIDMAVACLSRAVKLSPGVAEYQHTLGLALAAGGNHAAAVDAYRNAIQLSADFPDAHYNLGNALLKLKRFDEAIAAFQVAMRCRPDHGDANINLGSALAGSSRYAGAVEAFRQAIALNPNHAEAHMNLGLALVEERKFDEAIAVLRRSISLDPTSGESHWLLSLLSLLRGDFELGWREYEWRWHRREEKPHPQNLFSEPRWHGEDLAGRTILLHAEQGQGDAIQFIRYAPLVAGRGGRVIVQCPPRLTRLFKSVAGVADAVAPGGAGRFDVQCPLLSLPMIFQTRLDSIPASVPYLQADPAEKEKWATILSLHASRDVEQMRAQDSAGSAPRIDLSGAAELVRDADPPRITPGLLPKTREVPIPNRRLRVGLVWAGGPAYKDDHKRSITLTHFAPLAALPNFGFVSLQRGHAAAQPAEPPAGIKLIDLTAGLTDFADTAALMCNLDLVISVDTAVAHLAGALNLPIWILLPYNPDWRWLLDREDSPWYPSMRLFRQTERGDWHSVIRRVAMALTHLTSPRR